MASRTSTDPLEILIQMGVDLDDLSEQDYLGALMEAIATIEFQTKGKGDARSVALREEVVKERKRRRENPDPDVFFGNKPDYVQEKRKKISADAFKKGSAAGVNVAPKQKALPTSAIVPYQAPEAEEEGEKKKKEEPRNLLAEIAASVTNIADTLKNQYNLKKKEGEFDRKKAQRDKRKLDERNLEKGFSTLFKSAQRIIKPVQGLFDRIFNFIRAILIGKFLMGLVDFISKPENQKKLQNIIAFLGKHWKKLLSLYLVFGTGLGRFVFSLTKLLITGAIKLTVAVAKLLAAKKLVSGLGARRLARFLGGRRGQMLAAGLTTATVVGGTYAGVNALTGSGQEQQTQGFSGGGLAQSKIQPTPQAVKKDYSKGMPSAMKGAALGSLLGPLGMLAGAGIGSLFDKFSKKKDDTVTLSKPANIELEVPSGSEGQVDGPGGTDKVPAMLTAGEFVMSRGAVQKFGVQTLEGMNAAGGGTNQPKVINNKVYAAGGGQIGRVHRGGSPGDGYPGGRPGDSKGNDLAELFSGFGGRTSQSENYGVRVINEVAKKVYIMFNNDKERERRGGSPPPSSGGRTPPSAPPSSGERTPPPSSGPNIPGAGVAEEIYNRGKGFIGGIYDAAKPKIDAAMPQVQALPATIDYGSLYLKSQLGGVGGAITEADLSQTTKDEYTRAYQVAVTKLPQRRAGVESVIRQQQRILSNPDITEEQKKNAQRTLAINKSRLAKYDAGQVDVQYEDFKVDGKLTPTAAAAQKTMGAVWASDTGDGGFQIEKEPYDFPIVKDPVSLMNWKKLSEEEKYAWLDKQEPNLSVRKKLDPRPPYKGSLGAWGKQDIAEAMYSLNPAAAPMVTDVKIGGDTRPEAIADAVLNTVESIPVLGTGIAFARGLGMNLLFGKTRDVTKGPIEGAASDSLFRKLFPKQDKKGDPKAINIADQSGGLGSPDPAEKPKLTAQQIKNNQAYAASKGKYYSSTTGKTYANYAEALKDPAVAAGANKMEQKKQSVMNMIMGGKDAYYSSTTNQYYKNYAEALKDPKVKAAAQVEKTKQRLSFSPEQKPKSLAPEPPQNPSVNIIQLPNNKNQRGQSSAPGGGSYAPNINAGNGSSSKRKILGIF